MFSSLIIVGLTLFSRKPSGNKMRYNPIKIVNDSITNLLLQEG